MKKKTWKSCYNPDLDECIIQTIENKSDGKYSFNELKKELGISSRTLTKHLKVLEDETRNIIIRDNMEIPWSAGKKRYIRLTKVTTTKRKWYGFFIIDYKSVKGLCIDKKEKLENNEQKFRRMKLVLFLLFALAYGYMGYKESSKGVVIKRENRGNSTFPTTNRTVSVIGEPGFSPNDLDRMDYQLSILQTSMRANRFERKEAEELINEIFQYKEIRIKSFIYNEKIRYKIEDDILNEFLIYCCNIITNLVQVMRAYFFLFNKQGELDERKWFYHILGDETANTFFQQIEENQAEKKTIKDLYIEFNQFDKQFTNKEENKKLVGLIIQNCEKLDKDFFTKKKLEKSLLSKPDKINNSLISQLIVDSEDINQRQEKFKYLKTKYPFIFDEIRDIVNPPFSRRWFTIKLFFSNKIRKDNPINN